MDTRDWITVAAIVLAPLFAVQAQKLIERFREKRGRKHRIFYALMSTRRARVSQYHVESLNSIDIEFYGTRIFKFNRQSAKDKAVVLAWKEYLDHLNSLGEEPSKEALEVWTGKGNDLFTDLLYEMSKAVGYDFDKTHLKSSVYSPKAHGDQELEQRLIRENLLEILVGNKPIPMRIMLSDDALAKQNKIADAYIEQLEGRRALKVKIESDAPPATPPPP